MDVISQFIVDLSWGLTAGALIAAGTLAAQGIGVALAALAGLVVVLGVWRAVRKRRR